MNRVNAWKTRYSNTSYSSNITLKTIMLLQEAHALVWVVFSSVKMKSVNTFPQWAYHKKQESKMNRMARTKKTTAVSPYLMIPESITYGCNLRQSSQAYPRSRVYDKRNKVASFWYLTASNNSGLSFYRWNNKTIARSIYSPNQNRRRKKVLELKKKSPLT